MEIPGEKETRIPNASGDEHLKILDAFCFCLQALGAKNPPGPGEALLDLSEPQGLGFVLGFIVLLSKG